MEKEKRLKGIEEFKDIDRKDLMKKLWIKTIKVGKKREEGLTHKMKSLDISTIIGTVEHIHPTQPHFPLQLGWDLSVAKYPLYDVIGMLMVGRYKDHPGETPQDVKKLEDWSINLALDYIGCANVTTSPSELYRCVIERSANRTWGSPIENKKFKFPTKKVLEELVK